MPPSWLSCGPAPARSPQDAAVLGRCIEGLQSGLDGMVKEGEFWAGEAAKLSQRVSAGWRVRGLGWLGVAGGWVVVDGWVALAIRIG